MNTAQKLTARQRRFFLDVVSEAASSLRQAEIAKQVGISPSTVSRIMRTEEAVDAIESARARALAESWKHFDGLLTLAIDNLRHCLTSPMVSSSVKAQVSLKLMQLGLEGGAIRGTNIPVPVIIAPNISGIDIKPDLDIESFQRADTFEPSGTEDCDFQESLETGIQSALSNSRPKID